MKKRSLLILKPIFFYLFIPAVLLIIMVTTAQANRRFGEPSDSIAIQGRWDITINIAGKKYPSWFEIRHSGFRMLVGQFVGIDGSARPISRVHLINRKMSFAIPPQWEQESRYLSVEGTFQGDSLTGSMTFSNGNTYHWTGKRAPILRRKSEPVWGKPIQLFDGINLKGWHATGKNQWKAESGMLRSPHSGSNLLTNETFKDFKLHIEFRYPKESNSGVYLRGRYEVQVIDSKGLEPSNVLFGGIYGFLTPSYMVAKAPGRWQSFDITLVGRMVTVVANGKTIICNQEIPGITGGAIDSNEGAPGPILLQGDHGPIDYRNIIITPAG
ncbi:MAG: 3-keto-disaccharide hydrolase [Chitinophagaceae bacterium]